MKFAIVGCGYVSELYVKTLANHPELTLAGAYDTNDANLKAFLQLAPVKAYRDLDELCADPEIGLVVNLTNPRSHFEVTRRCLAARKHVYSEKPLGMTTAEATALAELADAQGLMLSSAPCSLLSEPAQTLGHAIRSGVIGRIRLVYANFDDGLIAPAMKPWTWRNGVGVPWPAKDEFEVGCTYEHAGYQLTWLAAFFGPVTRVTSFASCQIPDKGIPVDHMAPDFTVGCLEYGNGVVARLTCGLVAPRDKSLTIVGDDGVLFVGSVRDETAAVMVQARTMTRAQALLERVFLRPIDRFLSARAPWPGTHAFFQRRYVLGKAAPRRFAGESKRVDFMRGPGEMCEALREGRPSRLSSRLGVHVVELAERLQYPERFRDRPVVTSTFAPIAPVAWAD